MNIELTEFAKEGLMKCGRKRGVRDDFKFMVQATRRMEVPLIEMGRTYEGHVWGVGLGD